jgi:elongation factor P--(R)-beta-lysine ligase
VSKAPSAPPVSPWWTPETHADRRPVLLTRNRIEAALRGYFAAEEFVLVDPPGLQRSPGNETHLHAFRTTMIGNAGKEAPMYFCTSPEFSMKKLIAAGERRIATFSHVWRNRESGPLHHPEFTMLEWYRAGERYEAVMDDCIACVCLAAETAGTTALRWRGRAADPSPSRSG